MATWSADRATERWHGDHAGYDAIALPSQPIITMRDPGRIENRATFPRLVPVRGHEHRAVSHEQKQMVLDKWLSSCRPGSR